MKFNLMSKVRRRRNGLETVELFDFRHCEANCNTIVIASLAGAKQSHRRLLRQSLRSFLAMTRRGVNRLFQRSCLLFTVLIFTILLTTSLCLAQDLNFEVTVDRNKVSLGSSLKLNLNFYGTQDISAPELPNIDGFNWQYLGPSTRISIVNGQVSNSITHMYVLMPLKTGSFTIPPLTLQYKGKAYTSRPIPVEVVQGPAALPPGGVSQSDEAGPKDLEDRIFVVMEAGKAQAYVNEIIPITIKLYVNGLTIRDIQYPEFASEGFSVEKYEEHKQYQEVINGIMYDVIEFNTNVFALHSGNLKLGPAEIGCNLLVKSEPRNRGGSPFFDDDFFDNFFSRYQNYPLRLKSMDIPVTVIDLPQAGVPAGYDGALGNFNFYLDADPKVVKVGDPITLKMSVAGEGNIKTVKPPSLAGLEDNFKVYEPEIKQDGNTKAFEQVIIPKSDKITEIPKVDFSYFDTKSGRYTTITRGPIPVKVLPLPKGEELKVYGPSEEGPGATQKKETLGKDIIYIKDSPGDLRKKGNFLYKNRLFITFQLLPILAVLSVLILYRRKERLETDIRYARRLRAPRKAKKNLMRARRLLEAGERDKFFEAVFKTLQEYLGDKFHLPTAGITASVVEEELKPRSVEKDVLDRIIECFANCDTARYAPSDIKKEQMLHMFSLLEEIIDKLG